MRELLLKVRNKGLGVEVIYLDVKAINSFPDDLKLKFDDAISGKYQKEVVNISREDIGHIYDFAETLDDYEHGKEVSEDIIFDREKSLINKDFTKVIDVVFEAA